jgi:lipopolysaccharide transport system permease protein
MIQKLFVSFIMASRYRTLLRGFITREIKGRFAGTMAGIAWALLNPFAVIVVYMFVFSLVLRINVTVEETGTESFFIFFATGFVPWLIFSDSLSRSMGSLVDNAALITKVTFPVELLPVTSVLTGLLINGLAFIPLLGYLLFQGYLSWFWICLILVLPVQILFSLGLGMLFSSACVFFRDLKELTSLILMVWFFSTPIIYPLSMVPDSFQKIIQTNPMYMLVTLYRDILILHRLDVKLLMVSFLVAIIFYIMGSLFFARVKPGFGDVL